MAQKPKILLVDDDLDMCKTLKDVLSFESLYEINYITDSLKALKMIKRSNFDLAIIDYKMPKMDGIELIKQIKDEKNNLIIFLLTAFLSYDLAEEAKKMGASKVLSKFIWPEELINHVKSVLRR